MTFNGPGGYPIELAKHDPTVVLALIKRNIVSVLKRRKKIQINRTKHIHLIYTKESKTECGNYREISMSTAGGLYGCIIGTRIKAEMQEEQRRFQKNMH